MLKANPRQGYEPEPYYGNTKLANLLFGAELGRRATRTGLVSTMAHPGISATNLVASSDVRRHIDRDHAGIDKRCVSSHLTALVGSR